ncbi:deoxyribodipyrimidine photo-lyase, partial [Corynebacterium variabile]
MTTGPATTLVWFRDDLRLADNAALQWAAQRGEVIAVVIDEDAAATGVR